MRSHTSTFKENVKEMGRELDSIISYTVNEEEIELGNELLNSVTPVVQSALLKSVMKELDIDSNVEIPVGTTLNYKFGVSLNNSEYDYINFGNYIVYSSEKQEDTNSYNLICYDKMLSSMIEYSELKSLESMQKEFPMSIRDYIDCVCNDIGLTFKNKNEEFANFDRVMESDLYAGLGYTYRDIFDELAQVTASNIIINDNDEVEIRYINETNDTIDEEYLQNINVDFGEKYGPINSIVLSRAAESDNVYLQDEESIAQNGLCELKIVENQIMNFNDRNDYLPDILEKLNGLEFYINDFSSTGICYYEVADKYNVVVGETTYQCVLFNDEIKITQGLQEEIHTDMPEQAKTDYTKADKTDRKINQTYLMVDKQNGIIEGLASRTETVESNLEDNYYQKQDIEQLILNAESGLTNIFSASGGNNKMYNTGAWYGNNLEWDYWEGNVARKTEENSITGFAFLLQNGITKQTIELSDGYYSISFKYKKILDVANAKVRYNNREIVLEDEGIIQTTGLVNTKSFSFEMECDTDDGYEIYEIMLNHGEETYLPWSQNQNEIKTTNVNISKDITVNSNIENTRTSLGAIGLVGTNKTTNEIVFKQTEDGSYSKNIKCDKGEIARLSISEVGNQTWMVRM